MTANKPNLAAMLAVAGGLTLLAGPAGASTANPCGGSSQPSFPTSYSSTPQIDSETLAAQAAERAERRAARKAARDAAKAAKAAKDAAQASATEVTATQPTATQR